MPMYTSVPAKGSGRYTLQVYTKVTVSGPEPRKYRSTSRVTSALFKPIPTSRRPRSAPAAPGAVAREVPQVRRRIAIASLLAVALAAALFAGRSFAGLPGRPGVRWEARHIRIDKARLAAIDDVMDLIEPLWWTVNISSPEAYEASLAPFTRGQRLVYALQMYRLEVDNGGHGQFYGNSGGIVWRDALEGFELLGLRELADNLRASAALLGGDPPLDRGEREALLSELRPDFAEITEQFWKLEAQHDVDGAILAYARAHPEEFLFDGVVRVPTSDTVILRQFIIWFFP